VYMHPEVVASHSKPHLLRGDGAIGLNKINGAIGLCLQRVELGQRLLTQRRRKALQVYRLPGED